MVYESDFYTTRRPYRPSYSSTMKQEFFPWEKVPFVPRPSQIPDPFTVWGHKQYHTQQFQHSISTENIGHSTYPRYTNRSYYNKNLNIDKLHLKRPKKIIPEFSAHNCNSNNNMYVGKLIQRIPTITPISDRTPRHYIIRDYPDVSMRSAQEQYSYSYTDTSSSSDNYNHPRRTTSEISVKTEDGPRGIYSTERRFRSSSGSGPGYRSSYESHSSGRLPGGTTYRHYSYRI